MRILGISGSLRRASANSGMLRAAATYAGTLKDVEFTVADITTLPLYNSDLDGDAAPAEVLHFKHQIQASDAVLFACPEYNYSLTAPLKNALDWGSKHPAQLWRGKAAAIIGAGGGSGTVRAQLALRQVGVYLDLTFVNSPEVAIKRFEEKCFDEATGDLTNDAAGTKWSNRIAEMVDRLVRLEAMLHPPTEQARPAKRARTD